LGDKEEKEEEPQDVVYPVLKGVLEKLAIKVQVTTDRLLSENLKPLEV